MSCREGAERALGELSRGPSASGLWRGVPQGGQKGSSKPVERAVRGLPKGLSESAPKGLQRGLSEGCGEALRKRAHRQGLQAALKNLNFIPGRGVYFYGFDSRSRKHSENVSKTYKKR